MNVPKAYATSVRKLPIDMTLSVNPLGCSPMAMRAIRSIPMTDVSTYPEQSNLLRALAARFRVRTDMILLGIGSEQLIKLTCQTFLRAGDTVFVERGSFFLFSKEPALLGNPVTLFNLTTPPKPVNRPTLLFLANPTTPGGEDRSDTKILTAIDRINPKIVVIDEANGELRSRTFISKLKTRNNLVVLRTFSKTLGLAGLRVGMAFGSQNLISKMSDFQQPFPVSSIGLIAAQAALRDTSFIKKTTGFFDAERASLTTELKKRGFGVSQSVTNNLFISRPDSISIILELQKNGVSVIDGTFFPGCKTVGFRISLRNRKTNRKFLKALDKALSCLNKWNLLPSKEVL